MPILITDTFKDAYNFLMLSYRKDVQEFGFDHGKEYILTEEQFENFEAFCLIELRKNERFSSSFDS